jgi:NADH-quinone oxidoreductase subunit J
LFIRFRCFLTAIYSHPFNEVENTNSITTEQIGFGLLSYEEGGFILPFEVISILLLASMIGAIVIAKGKKPEVGSPKSEEQKTEI